MRASRALKTAVLIVAFYGGERGDSNRRRLRMASQPAGRELELSTAASVEVGSDVCAVGPRRNGLAVRNGLARSFDGRLSVFPVVHSA
jgi:hypothetical protein